MEQFVKDACGLRNAEIHGDHPVRRTMTLLNGATTDGLALVVGDLGRLIGRAIQLVLTELTRPTGLPSS